MKDNNHTDVELLTDFAIDVSESANGLSVLIKHNYYSTDNDNGRALLDHILDGLVLASDRIFLLIITDSAVKLLESSPRITDLMTHVNTTLICADSAAYYGISIPDDPDGKVHAVSMADITDQIIESRPNIIID